MWCVGMQATCIQSYDRPAALDETISIFVNCPADHSMPSCFMRARFASRTGCYGLATPKPLTTQHIQNVDIDARNAHTGLDRP